ncbi:lipocalin-like domain-containing protein [Bradyrhizobium sp.]|uniref:lipocalin-like domain-containing protein n=1 Tax=Bradyrhizobium sp. TaxID=376 RepID=UPI002D6CA98D|nr:lipocalin-like domain-containing protein [Bradyrhizobium sp.]HZR76381.1 lipocalin-like domain-containing protein [Bradyrhizobium sp.]
MRRFWFTFACLLLAGFPPLAAHAEPAELVGVWKLKSFVFESIESKERRNVYGEKPAGYLVITPERFTTVITGEGRKPPHTDEDRLSNFLSLTAYTGLYRVEGNQLTTKIDVAWTEAWKGTDQVRFFRVEGDRLFIESAPTISANFPELGKVRAILEWERSR